MRRHGYPVPYYEYHGADPSAYYGIPYRTEGGVPFPRKAKKSFAEKLSNKLDKLAKPKEKDRGFNAAYQEVYRDHFGNILVPRSGSYSKAADPWPHYSASPGPKRTFHNVIHRGRSAPGSSSSHAVANRTWSGWDSGGFTPHPVPRSTVSNDHTIYGDVLYDEYHNFAINSNVCMCEDYLGGTQRGKKGKKKCKKCGFDRLGFEQQKGIRRSISEESVNAQYTDPYEYMRRRRLVNPKPVFYDEQDEYEDIDFISRPKRSNSTRKMKPKESRSRSPQRRSNSPLHKKNVRTQSMIVNNRNQLNTKDNKEMQNIAIRASPMRSVSSVTKTKNNNEQNRNVVTVNGCATKNSSIIYLSPDATAPPTPLEKDYPGANTITISTSTPAKLYTQGSIRVSPYDLIKKYIQDSPVNSLSDSNLSSDDPPQKSDHKSEESDFSYSDDDNGNDSVSHFTSSNGFKISGQKIQIYSDGSVTATDSRNIRAYSLSESEDESDKESEYSNSNYDADCSVVESPRFPIKVVDDIPRKPPRRKSSEKESIRIAEDIERLQLQDLNDSDAPRSSPNSNDMKTFPRSSFPRKEILSQISNEKTVVHRKTSSDSQKSAASRSKSFNGSRESLNLFGSVDFKNFGISKNFSSEIIQELYGSKTSLLKHLDQQREERKLKQSELNLGDDVKTREASVSDLLSKSTDSILDSSRKSSADNSACLCNKAGLEETKIQTTSKQVSAEKPELRGQHMFHDTTRIRLMSRPSLKDALQSFSTGSTKLGRVGISQSFRERMTTPLRPKEPPPPPPPSIQSASGGNSPSYSLAKKFFSFNKSEIKRINKFLGISNISESEKQQESNIYDIAENDEAHSELGVTVVDNSTFYTGDTELSNPQALKKNVSLRLRPKSNEFSLSRDPVKPPRTKRERSKSFTPRSNPLVKTSIFNRSLSHIPKSSSSSSLSGKHISRSDSCKKMISNANNSEANQTKRTLSSSDLVHIFPDEERRSFKDIRKILSSPSISSSSSCSTNQIYRPKSQLSNSSSVINNSIKEEQVAVLPTRDAFFDHIYEEIRDKDVIAPSVQRKRPLPPLPAEKQPSPSRSSPIISDPSSPVKSIFEGASKYDILNYLEDARERGLTDCDLDLDEEEEAENAVESQQPALVLSSRNHTNRISNISTNSTDSSESDHIVVAKEKLSSAEIERNDSGLGSETGRGRATTKVVVRKRSDEETEDLTCLDCDQVLELHEGENQDIGEAPLCEPCATRRVERKEIITEIIETEIKYGRDLRIIYEEFYRPMMVAGLLTPEQLANVFLNVEELIQVNAKFTEGLKDAIEIALDQGDEDMCTVSIGKLFLEASPMLGAFKSYCTRQGSASALLASLEREKELLRIFLKVSQMENTILRRMNLSSFLMVPVQRVTRYPLLLSRLLKVTPSQHNDKDALQESRELIEQGLDSMNQEATRDSGTTKLWRRISMINPPYRRSENQIDLLGSTTWGVRKMVLETLGWGKEAREDISFVLEARLLYTQPTDVNWRNLFAVKMSPTNALLVTLGQNTITPSIKLLKEETPKFSKETGCREAALILLKEKGMRYSPVREPLMLDKCVICWEQDWDDCFEVTEFTTKESYIFKGEDMQQTLHWFQCIKFYCNGLGGWRRRRNALANIMINGMARSEEIGREFNLIS
eukprot:GFUD01003717.1.p1 GENE.GFUD01003717.1~~GFUD01003717.1.p1  ORF type:complete len:1661 (+),score=297.05 GFUD01003717.1:288-5270(+)